MIHLCNAEILGLQKQACNIIQLQKDIETSS